MAASTIANEIFADRFWTIDIIDAFQAEAVMLQAMNFNIDFGDVLKWSDLVCDAPRILEQEVTTSRAIGT